MNPRFGSVIRFCERAIEFSFYMLLITVAFSISLVEVSSTIMIVCWLVVLALKRDFRSLNTLPVKLLALYFVWVVLSCFNSEYFKESFRGIFKVAEYGMLFVVVSTVVKDDRIKRNTFYTLGFSSIIICLNGIMQYFIGYDLIRHRNLIQDDYLHRISSSFVHPNDFGGYLVVIIPIFVAFLLVKNRDIRKQAFICCILICSLVALFLTKSRGAWLSLSAALLVLGALKTRRSFLVLLLVIVLLFSAFPQSVKQQIFNLADLSSGTVWERIMLWKGTVDMIKTHPVLGFGINTYSRNFPLYKPAVYPDCRYAHNCYLQMASEVGIVGMLLFLSFLICVIVICISRIKTMTESCNKTFLLGATSAIIGFSINALFDTHFYSLTLVVLFNVILGYCYGISKETT